MDSLANTELIGFMHKNKIKQSNKNMLLAMIPLYLMGWFYYGFQSVILGLVAFLTGIFVDYLSAKLRKTKRDTRDWSSSVSTMLMVLLLPATTPLWIVLLGSLVALLVAKLPFGGTASYIFHPTAVAYCFLAISFPEILFQYPIPFQSVGIINNTVQNLATGAEGSLRLGGVPSTDIIKILIGNVPGPIGASSVIVILSCLSLLLLTRSVDYKILVPFFGSVALMAFLFPRVITGRYSSVFYELFSGTIIFCGIFLASDYTTNPKKFYAKIIYAISLGITTMLFQYFGAVQHGFCFALLLSNAAIPLFDSISLPSPRDQKSAEVAVE